MRGIQWSPVNSPHKGQWHGALMFSLICAWINGWINNREAGDLRSHRAHYDVIVMRHIKVNVSETIFAVVLWKCWNRTKTDTLFIEQTGRWRGFDHVTYTRLIRTMSRSCIDLISRIGYLYQSINLIVPVLYLYMSLSWSSLYLQMSQPLVVLGHQQVQQWL